MRLPLALAAIAALAPACHHDAADDEASGIRLTGQVVDESGAPVPGARLTAGGAGNGASIATDAAGHFVLERDAAATQAMVLSVAATGFASRAIRLEASATAPANLAVTLRRIGLVTDVDMPAAGAAPVSVTVTRQDSTATLTLPPGSLVLPGGAAVSGKVTVTMTYWNPGEAMTSAPGTLATTAAGQDGVVAISSLGMADIAISQGGMPLAVAPGSQLGWEVVLPASGQKLVASLGAVLPATALYALDPNTALFTAVTAYGTALTYDASRGALQAQLPHLSVWNYDYVCNASGGCMTTCNGGCVQGQAFDCSGTPLASQEVLIWAMGRSNLLSGGGDFGIVRFRATTDPNGHYCATLGVEPAGYGDATAEVALHVSGTDGPTASNLTCPIEGACRICNQTDPLCNTCANGTPSGSPSPALLSYTISRDVYCPSAQCTTLADTYIGPSCQESGGCALPLLQRGQACNVHQQPRGCCAPGLHCADSLCVPDVGY